jgi:hypothetical protein
MEGNMNIETQQEVVGEVLSKIKWSIDSEAIVAGGAPRNWHLGGLANDIDLYMRSHCINTVGRTKYQIKNLLGDGVVWERATEVNNYKFGMDIEIVSIISFTYKGVLFQLIVCNPNYAYTNFKMQVVKHMDIGINRVWCDWYGKGERNINFTGEALKDFNDKTLTLFKDCMTDTQLVHCMKTHLPKMVKYFPDYKIIM